MHTRTTAGNLTSNADALVGQCYAELRLLAESYFNRFPSNTLQPTILVHEAYLKIAHAEGGSGAPIVDREHFFAIAATAMRQVLIDYARRRHAHKRSGPANTGNSSPKPADENPIPSERRIRVEIRDVENPSRALTVLDVVALNDALERLSAMDPRAAKLVELRFLAGLTVVEAAQALGIARATAEADWRAARAWLAAELSPDEANNGDAI